jgi:hypothetical protein
MLWEALVEWDQLSAKWFKTAFDSLDVDGLQTAVHKFIQTIYVLEKGESDARKKTACWLLFTAAL